MPTRLPSCGFPKPAPCGKTPLTASGLSKSYGSLEVFTDVDIAVDRGARVVVLGLNGAGKTTLLRILAGLGPADTGSVAPGHGLQARLLRAGARDARPGTHGPREHALAAPDLIDTELRSVLGSFLFSGDDVDKPAGGVVRRREDPPGAGDAGRVQRNVLLLDEPTNNLDPASRAEVLTALRTYPGAIVLVTHDEGAVDALGPERLILLPDGVEDLWSDSYADLVALA